MGARKLELLSPAKNLEVGKAALMAGADAVYIGGPSFGARASAGNSMEDIATLCAFAHRFGAHVYLTVNTLLYDHELAEVESLIAQARSAGVDALIIQDPAILTMKSVRDLELHASTQMNIDTLEKVAFCKQLGFSQIVVPREFSLEEIKSFTSAYPDTRFEVFVSGAMCVSVSGICYISELMTNRSANRGECAQICRLPMDFYHQDQLLASGHLLSMKDNLRLHELEDLVAAGASSFKIEGRLKDRDYVVNQVAAFRERLDKIIAASNGKYERASHGQMHHDFVPDVSKTFNRGFTSAFLQGDNANMINTRSPKSTGEAIGVVLKVNRDNSVDVKLKSACTLANGDSFTFFASNNELLGFRANKVESLGTKGQVRLFLLNKVPELKVGCELNRNVDTIFIKSINMPKALVRKMELKAQVSLHQDVLTVTFTDSLKRSGQASLVLDKNNDDLPTLTTQVMASKLPKLGDEHLVLVDSSFELNQSIALPLSQFNNLRRQALQNYLERAQMSRVQCSEHGWDYDNEAYIFKGLPDNFTGAIGSVDERLICNHQARAFYEQSMGGHIELPKPLIAKAVMTCRNCLIKNHALCHDEGGSTKGFYLKIGKHTFDVVTNCRRCLMYLVPRENQFCNLF